MSTVNYSNESTSSPQRSPLPFDPDATISNTPPNTPPRTPPQNEKKRKDREDSISPLSKKAYQAYKNCMKVESPEAKKGYAFVRDIQKQIQDSNQVMCVPGDENRPETIISKEALYVMMRSAGKGTESEAFHTTAIYEEKSPEKKVVKCSSRKPFSPQKNLLKALSQVDHIDTIERTGQTLSGDRFIAVFKPSEGDILHLNYQEIDKPVEFILKSLIGFAKGMRSFHSKGQIHRDIKGGNLLFNKEGDAKVTDTGLLMKVLAAGEKHSVGCSPHYAPSFIWEDISQQRIELQGKLFSMGHQSKAGDVFSFGVTIQKDILDKLINEIGSGHGVKIDNEYERIEGPFTQEALVQHEKSAPGQRVIYIPRKGQKEEALLKSPLLEGVRQRTLEALDKLQPHLSEKEIGTLKALAKLSHSLQKEKEEDVPPIEAVLEELTKIAQIFE